MSNDTAPDDGGSMTAPVSAGAKTPGQIALEAFFAKQIEAGTSGWWEESSADYREKFERVASAVLAAGRVEVAPVAPSESVAAWQARHFFRDDDPGWSNWYEVKASELGYYQRRALDKPNDCQVRPLYAAPSVAPVAELLAYIEREYEVLADHRNSWPGRDTAAGQSKLCQLRDLIASATGRSAQEVQDDFGTRRARAALAAVKEAGHG
jgi:hypothetical protein